MKVLNDISIWDYKVAKKDLKDHENDAAQLEKSTEELAAASHKIYEILQKIDLIAPLRGAVAREGNIAELRALGA